MHVLLVSAVFPPEPLVSAQTSAQLAEALAQRGHQVDVITTFPNRPAGRLYPGYTRSLFRRERTHQGVQITRCYSILSPQSSLISRFLENISFGLTGGWAVMRLAAPDVVYANTWPVLAIGMLAAICKLRRIPLVISVQDVYPESLVAQQRIADDGFIARWMRWLDGVIARRAQAVLVISERFARIYRDSRRVASARVHVVPNWVDHKSIDLSADTGEFRATNSVPADAFVVGFGGNIGVAAGVEQVIEAFGSLQDLKDLHLVIAGEGSRLSACQKLARSTGERITFHTPWPVEETSVLLRAADVLVLPTNDRQSLSSVPSKLIAYMLAGRPIVAVALPESETAKIIEQAGCGWTAPPGHPEMLAALLREVTNTDPIQRDMCGQAGRAFALKNFTTDVCLPQVLSILKKAAG